MVTFSVSCDFFVLGPGVLKRDVIISKLHSFDIDCFPFELCIQSYSGRSNGVPSLQRFFRTTYRFATTR